MEQKINEYLSVINEIIDLQKELSDEEVQELKNIISIIIEHEKLYEFSSERPRILKVIESLI